MNTEYTYPGMTPDIEKYLHLQKLHPGYKYAGSSTPTPESNAAVEAWKRDVETSKAALPEGEPAAYYHAHKVWLCRDETASGEPQEEVSPNGKYRLVVTQHTTGKGRGTAPRVGSTRGTHSSPMSAATMVPSLSHGSRVMAKQGTTTWCAVRTTKGRRS